MVSGLLSTMRSSFLPFGWNDADAAQSAAIDVAGGVDLDAIRHLGFGLAQVGEHALRLPRQHAVRQDMEGGNQAAARVVDLEHALVGRKGKPVGNDEVVDQQAHRVALRRLLGSSVFRSRHKRP